MRSFESGREEGRGALGIFNEVIVSRRMCGNSILEVGSLRWIASVMTLSYCYLTMLKIYQLSLWLEALYFSIPIAKTTLVSATRQSK